MPIIRITKQVVEDAKKAREAALAKDPDFRASEEKLEQEQKEAMEQDEKEVQEAPPEIIVEPPIQTPSLPATFSLTPRESCHRTDNPFTFASLYICGAYFEPKCYEESPWSYDGQHSKDTVYFEMFRSANPTLDYSIYGNRLIAPHIELRCNIANLDTNARNKELALIFGFEALSESRLLIYTQNGFLSDETLTPDDNQFLMEIESLDFLHLYFIHSCREGILHGGDWFFKGITGYVV